MSPANADLWRLWVAVRTQWRSGPLGPVGLDYLAVAMVAQAQGLEFATPRVGEAIRLMEAEYLAAYARAAHPSNLRARP